MTGNSDYYIMLALSRWEAEGGNLGVLPERDQAKESSRTFLSDVSNKMRHDKIILTDMDRYRLGTLLSCSETAGYGSPRTRFDLETQLEEAETIPAQRAPRSLVTMNSTIRLVDLESGAGRVYTLVYPEDRDLIPHSVGILQPLGQRILGRRNGDVVHAMEGGIPRRFKIEAIDYQPEAAGAYHL